MRIKRHLDSLAGRLFLSVVFALTSAGNAFPAGSDSREIPATVSPDWVVRHLGDPRVIVLDIRSGEQYKKGHIPGAVHIPVNSWAVTQGGLTLELPSEDALRDLIGKSGIKANSYVVVVNRTDTDFSRADSARVAWTLYVAGIANAAVLDGGYNRWIKEKKPTSAEDVKPQTGVYAGKKNSGTLASKEYVLRRLGKSLVADARVPEDYFGISTQRGHIRTAANLPAPWIFESDGTFKSTQVLQAMASGVLGTNKSREIILYCEVGGYASAWWFVLSQVLGYQDVKVYDGSMEEWIKDPAAPTSAYSWR